LDTRAYKDLEETKALKDGKDLWERRAFSAHKVPKVYWATKEHKRLEGYKAIKEYRVTKAEILQLDL
jgi:hypothetical protein